MVGIILISENREADEMLRATRRLLGRTKGIASVQLKPGNSIEKMQETLEGAIRRMKTVEGILLLTDIYGSTQCNVCMKFLKKGAVELVTGYNLPMLVKLGMVHRKMPFKELLPFIRKYGREQIRHIRRNNHS